MGSQASQQMAALDGILLLITNPEMVKKNIEALKEKIAQSEGMVALAREEQAKAKELVDGHAGRESELGKMVDHVAIREANVATTQAALDAYRNDLNAQEAALKAKSDEHTKNSNDLAARELRLKSGEQSLKERGNAIEHHHDQRMAKLDQREEALIERETTLMAGQADIKSKLEKMKQLAS